jgi:succinate dehydrogenase hydrophobic anchor subunit
MSVEDSGYWYARAGSAIIKTLATTIIIAATIAADDVTNDAAGPNWARALMAVLSVLLIQTQ